MTTRRRNLIVLVCIVALSVAGAVLLAPSLRERTPIEAIPSGAFLVITVDLVKLRQSPLARELGDVREVSDVTRECGFDPLERARSIAIGVPEKPDGVFGVAIAHDIPRDDLAKCAERVIGARSATPRVVERRSWIVVEQEGFLNEATRPKIAYRDGAPLLVARGDYLATMQATLDGPKHDLAEHEALRKIATAHAGADALLIATALLPKSVRDKIRDELATEADTSESKKTTMNAILAVRSLALAISARGDSLDVFAELSCEDPASCATVRDFLDKKRKSLAQDPGARLVGLGAILDGIRLESNGAVVDATVSAPETEVVRAARAVLGTSGFPAPR